MSLLSFQSLFPCILISMVFVDNGEDPAVLPVSCDIATVVSRRPVRGLS